MNQKEKMRMMTFKDHMDDEEIIHLERDIAQLQEIAERFHHDPPAPSESSNDSINKYELMNNRGDVNTTPAPGINSTKYCISMKKLCPDHSDKTSFAFADRSLAGSTGSSLICVYK